MALNTSALAGLNAACGGALGDLSAISGLGSQLSSLVSDTVASVASGLFDSVTANLGVVNALNIGLQVGNLPSISDVTAVKDYLNSTAASALDTFDVAVATLSQLELIKSETENVLAIFPPF
jgi:hypothetical protein